MFNCFLNCLLIAYYTHGGHHYGVVDASYQDDTLLGSDSHPVADDGVGTAAADAAAAGRVTEAPADPYSEAVASDGLVTGSEESVPALPPWRRKQPLATPVAKPSATPCGPVPKSRPKMGTQATHERRARKKYAKDHDPAIKALENGRRNARHERAALRQSVGGSSGSVNHWPPPPPPPKWVPPVPPPPIAKRVRPEPPPPPAPVAAYRGTTPGPMNPRGSVAACLPRQPSYPPPVYFSEEHVRVLASVLRANLEDRIPATYDEI